MDPDVFLTIAFAVYAVVSTLGVAVALTMRNPREAGMDDDTANLRAAETLRPPAQSKRDGDTVSGRPGSRPV
jgi:hypothetical protein